MVMHGSISQSENRISTPTLSFCFFTVRYSLLYHSPRIMVGVLIVFKTSAYFFPLSLALFLSLLVLLREAEKENDSKKAIAVVKRKKEKKRWSKFETSKNSLPSWSTSTIFIETLPSSAYLWFWNPPSLNFPFSSKFAHKREFFWFNMFISEKGRCSLNLYIIAMQLFPL